MEEKTGNKVEIEKEAKEIVDLTDEEIRTGIYKLKHPITFEGKEIKELDLKPLENVKGKHIEEARQTMRRLGYITNPTAYSVTPEFCYCILATMGIAPLELITELYSLDYVLLQRQVISFLFQ